MKTPIEVGLLEQYGSEKIPSSNSVAYRLLFILLDGKARSRLDLDIAINGTVNNAVTRLRGEFHWLVHHKDGYWWLDTKHLPIDGSICSRANREASVEAYKLYAEHSANQAKRERERVPRAMQAVIKALEEFKKVNAE
jgi:hypothetical protein